MKKTLFILVSAAMVLSLVITMGLSGCKTKSADTTAAQTAVETAAATETVAEATTTAATEAGPAEEIVLKLIWSNEGDIPGGGKWLTEMAQKFKEENPNITVEVAENTIDQLIPSWQAAVEAKSGVDIQFFWGGLWNMEDVWAGNVEDITKYIPEEEWQNWLNKDDVSFQGKPWIAPWYNFALPAMVYNKKLLAKAGLDPSKPPTSWTEFITSCEALKKAGITGFAFGLKDAWGAEPVWSLFGPAATDDIKEVKLAATREGAYLEDNNKDWLVKLYELYTKGYLMKDVMSVDYIPGRDSFLDGTSGFGQIMSGRLSEVVNTMGGREAVDFMPVPVFGSGKLTGKENTQTQSFGIPSFSEHKKEAADFIMFMHRPENLNRLYEITNFFPSDKRFDPATLKTDVEKDYWKVYSNDPVPYFGIYAPSMVIYEGIYVAAQMVCSGSTPDEAAALIEQTAAKWRGLNPEMVENLKAWAQ